MGDDGRRVETLLDERNELMNAFGLGPFRDGLVRDRIAAIDKEIRSIAAGTLGRTNNDIP